MQLVVVAAVMAAVMAAAMICQRRLQNAVLGFIVIFLCWLCLLCSLVGYAVVFVGGVSNFVTH